MFKLKVFAWACPRAQDGRVGKRGKPRESVSHTLPAPQVLPDLADHFQHLFSPEVLLRALSAAAYSPYHDLRKLVSSSQFVGEESELHRKDQCCVCVWYMDLFFLV